MQRKAAEGAVGAESSSARERKGLAGVIGKSNGQGRHDCNEGRGNKQRRKKAIEAKGLSWNKNKCNMLAMKAFRKL